MKAEVVSMTADNLDMEAIRRGGDILKQGGLVAFPTETVYGLGGDALNPQASMKIYAAKGRPSDNPLIVHIAEFDKLAPIVAEVPEKAKILAEVRVGNCLPLELIPVGTMVHNIELHPGKGGQMVRSAGNGAQLMAKEGKYATLRLPSGEMRMVPIVCRASVGIVGNGDHNLINIGKAGRKRNMGIRPTVRGSVMNPNDHPHGGGEGKTGIGRPGPCTPWGKPALGLKTRKKNKPSNKLIVRRRDGKALTK